MVVCKARSDLCSLHVWTCASGLIAMINPEGCSLMKGGARDIITVSQAEVAKFSAERFRGEEREAVGHVWVKWCEGGEKR